MIDDRPAHTSNQRASEVKRKGPALLQGKATQKVATQLVKRSRWLAPRQTFSFPFLTLWKIAVRSLKHRCKILNHGNLQHRAKSCAQSTEHAKTQNPTRVPDKAHCYAKCYQRPQFYPSPGRSSVKS